MALLNFFKRIDPFKEKKIQSVLPKLDGLLALSMQSSVTEAVNYCCVARPLIFPGHYCLQYKCPHFQCLVTEDCLFSHKKLLQGMLIHLKVYQRKANLFNM